MMYCVISVTILCRNRN